jgi:ABC-type multidrug transport system ATPase subunit
MKMFCQIKGIPDE